jgi:hypothetical protein
VREFSADEIKRQFRNGQDFNDLFEAFREAIEHNISDVDVYRELFSNSSLKPEELLFFAKKIERGFPHMGFDVYMWLSKVMESKTPHSDSLELSFLCLKKASEFDRKSLDPFLSACTLFDPDLKIPDMENVISFLKEGLPFVDDPVPLYKQLSVFYSSMGNEEMSAYFDRKAQSSS